MYCFRIETKLNVSSEAGKLDYTDEYIRVSPHVLFLLISVNYQPDLHVLISDPEIGGDITM